MPVLAALIALAMPAQAQDERVPQTWQAVDASTGQLTGITDLQALLFMFPDSASVRRRLIAAYIGEARRADALAQAVELAERGYVFSAEAQELLLTFEPSDEQRAALGLQLANGKPLEASHAVASVPADVHLVEGAWRDPKSGDLFVTSVVSRALFVRRGEGNWSAVPISGAGSLSGITFDPAAGLLWVASAVFEETPNPETAFRGVIAIDPSTGLEKRRLPAPDGGSPSDLVMAGGSILASDPLTGALYVARPTDEELSVLVEPGTFRSPQGLIPWGDDVLLVSDYAYGLAIVDTDARAWRVESDVPVLLDGIDGMWRHGDRIIAVQNGARPPRIVELTMSSGGRRVTALRELERANSGWTEPVSGTVVGDDLVYVATGQWGSFGEGGALREGAVAMPTELRVLPLSETPPQPR